MKISKLEKLFSEISSITGLENIGYHRVSEERLIPIHKTTRGLNINKWKKIHNKKPAYISDSCILEDVVYNQKIVVIKDVENHEGYTEHLMELNIKSLLMIPIIENSKVYGFIQGVSIGKKCSFTYRQIEKCVDIIDSYKEGLVQLCE